MRHRRRHREGERREGKRERGRGVWQDVATVNTKERPGWGGGGGARGEIRRETEKGGGWGGVVPGRSKRKRVTLEKDPFCSERLQ